MIAIINTGENPSPTGKHRYRVQINRELITEFTHIREDGLELCLRRAADAVAKAERDSLLIAAPTMPTEGEQQGTCCYGGLKTKPECASCSAWKPTNTGQ